MGLFNHFPYTNFHELNIDWLMQQVKKIPDQNLFIVNAKTSHGVTTLDRTFDEINDARLNKDLIALKYNYGTTFPTVQSTDSGHTVILTWMNPAQYDYEEKTFNLWARQITITDANEVTEEGFYIAMEKEET